MDLSPDSKFSLLCRKIVDLAKLSILWLLGCLPLITAGAATAALLSCLYAFRDGEACGAGCFVRSFRRVFLQATAVWLGSVVLAAALTADYLLLAGMDFPGRMACVAAVFFAGGLLALFSGMVYPLLARFPQRLRDTVVNAVLLSLARLPRLLLVTGMNLLPLLLFVLLPQVTLLLLWLWPCGGIALVGLYDLYVLEPVLAPFAGPPEDPDTQDL